MSDEDDPNLTIVDPPCEIDMAHASDDGNNTSQPEAGPPPSAAERIQLQMLAQMAEIMKEFRGLSTEVRHIGQRVSAIENPGSSQQPANANLLQHEPANLNLLEHEPANANLLQHEPAQPYMRPASATSWNGPTSSQVSGANVLAPKPFELPRFSGSASQWPIFISAYRQSTAALGYSALQNIFRLQRCLEGDAKLAVESLLMSPDNLEDLIETLELRFGRPEQLCHDQITKIRELPQIREHQFEQLISFSSHVSNAVAFLNTDASRHVLTESSLLKKCWTSFSRRENTSGCNIRRQSTEGQLLFTFHNG